jgi:hypothetical protein
LNRTYPECVGSFFKFEEGFGTSEGFCDGLLGSFLRYMPTCGYIKYCSYVATYAFLVVYDLGMVNFYSAVDKVLVGA